MNRRDFITKAGLGTLAAASLPALAKTLAWPDSASAHLGRGFYFAAVGFAAPPDRIILTGAGRYSSRDVHGGGNFTHFQATGSPPFPIVGSGRWIATELLSFTPTTPPGFGAHRGGILEMQVKLFPTGGSSISGVTMKVVCNIGPGGLSTGEEEGVTLTVPGAPFGPFAPSDPPTGITAFVQGTVPF